MIESSVRYAMIQGSRFELSGSHCSIILHTTMKLASTNSRDMRNQPPSLPIGRPTTILDLETLLSQMHPGKAYTTRLKAHSKIFFPWLHTHMVCTNKASLRIAVREFGAPNTVCIRIATFNGLTNQSSLDLLVEVSVENDLSPSTRRQRDCPAWRRSLQAWAVFRQRVIAHYKEAPDELKRQRMMQVYLLKGWFDRR